MTCFSRIITVSVLGRDCKSSAEEGRPDGKQEVMKVALLEGSRGGGEVHF